MPVSEIWGFAGRITRYHQKAIHMTTDHVSPDLRFMAYIAAGISRHLQQFNSCDEALTLRFTGAECRSFGRAGNCLWRLGCAVGDAGPGRDTLAYADFIGGQDYIRAFRLLDGPEILETVGIGRPLPPAAPHKSELLESYMELTTGWGDPVLPTTRHPFDFAERFLPEIEALATAGYIERQGHRAIWTDKIAPVMFDIYEWDRETGEAIGDAPDSIKPAAERLLAETSDLTRARLQKLARETGPMSFELRLEREHDGLFFTKNPDGTERNNFDNRIFNRLVVQAVYPLLKGAG